MQLGAGIRALLAAAFLLTSTSARGNVIDVFAQDFEFVPAEVGIAPGDTIRWTNVSQSVHTVTSGLGSLDPQAGALFDAQLDPGEQYSHGFTANGTYPYFCGLHEHLNMRGTIFVSGAQLAAGEPAPAAPTLAPVAPNPVRDAATIVFSLARAGQVRLEVFDIRGRRVASLLDGPLGPGDHAIPWRVPQRRRLPAGAYAVLLTADGTSASRLFVLLR